MKITLIFPKKDGDPGAMGITVPYVLPHLAAITPPNHDVRLVNLFKETIDERAVPDLVGISVMTPMADDAYILADSFRRKGVKVVLGGHHVSAMPFEAISHADAVVVGEAEETWPLLLADAEAGSLRQFYVAGPLDSYFHFPQGTMRHVPSRPSLESLPMPRRDLLKGTYFFDAVVTTRGCQYQCKFCGTARFYGGMVRHRPVEQVVDEVSRMRPFWLMADDDIFGDLEFRLALYERLAGLKKFMRWHGAGSLAVASEKIGDDVLRLAAKSGLNAVFIGLESAEEETVKSVRITGKLRQGENVDFRKTVERIKKIKGHGIMVMGFFVLGFDTDTRETFDKTLELCDESGVVPIPFLLMPLPGTSLWDDYGGRLLPGMPWRNWDAVHALYNHPTMGPREREEMLYRLRLTSYTFRRIMRRLTGLTPGNKFFSFMMQMGLRRSFESDWGRVRLYGEQGDTETPKIQ